ncbi:hypothetical protein [Sulfurospirillum multivorans]|uniref:Uncharacterized protein n=2 Tax=Sulfurospirillum multivorans TaxID=66821 RepID=A0AA86DYG6_SULMK|nr:hypothetical protein [Sulfurospirillum multivorans]AHJ12343.1 hypothetical protein SMUL_1077 [Sulfurospirillum multivorans DSM 12446]AHJ13253.1 hypothetical protein SMUL_1998 [Sulfurospirillum multivorans DSM 12446]QEH05841.1 hypothetical protein SMN_1067 [Sulfurospirillum multivorans]QEH06742.1 hypothetical protein SMN_1977 [Sulfurospirillum multivorans]
MQHKNVGLGNIHQIHNYEFETIVERDAFIPSLEDLKLICLVNGPFSYYSLKSVEPIEWKPLSTVTINLEDFSVYSQAETLELLSAKQNIYDVTSSKYKCGYLRGGKEVFGIEVDCGALPNATTKNITIPNYEINYNYWINASGSYALKEKTIMPLPYVGINQNGATNINIAIVNETIRIVNFYNYSTYNAKIVLNYTKG